MQQNLNFYIIFNKLNNFYRCNLKLQEVQNGHPVSSMILSPSKVYVMPHL